MSQISFSKMHGAGNDFVMINQIEQKLEIPVEELAKVLCDRHFAIGADGLILIEKSEAADFRMLYFNADGSRSVCGNGMRCAAKFIKDQGLIDRSAKQLKLETDREVVDIEFITEGQVKVYMGAPEFKPSLIPINSENEYLDQPLELAGTSFQISAVSMGNPHCVILVDTLSDDIVLTYGPLLEKHEFFPRKTNVEFVKLESPKLARIRVWERGVGETLACGTGISGVFAVLRKLQKAEDSMQIFAPGGSFRVDWCEDRQGIYLTGPVKTVFNGQFDIDSLTKKF